MQTIHLETKIAAPIQRCFLLSTRVELVQQTLGMRLVGGITHGHITADSRVVWRGWKFGLPTQHHTLITGYEAPRAATAAGDLHAAAANQPVAWFQDSQKQGRFAAFAHDHYFRESQSESGNAITTCEDIIRFTLPFGLAGRAVARRIVAPHILRLAQKRFALLKRVAEGDNWQNYLR